MFYTKREVQSLIITIKLLFFLFSLFKFIKMFSIQIDTSIVKASAKMKVVKI